MKTVPDKNAADDAELEWEVTTQSLDSGKPRASRMPLICWIWAFWLEMMDRRMTSMAQDVSWSVGSSSEVDGAVFRDSQRRVLVLRRALAMFTAFWWWGIIWWMKSATSSVFPLTLDVIPTIMWQFIELRQPAKAWSSSLSSSVSHTNVSGHSSWGSFKFKRKWYERSFSLILTC